MNNKLLLPLLAFATLFFMFIFFVTNPSYEKSIKAKYYYEMGDYKEAYTFANEAFSLDIYNRMASTIMAQSKTSLKYVAYVNDAKKYMKQINEIATHSTITDADKAKMRLICNIMIDWYPKLAPSVITDQALVNEVKDYYNNFEKLLEKVTR